MVKNIRDKWPHLRKCETLDNYPRIQGFDFEKFDFQEFLDSFATTGFQATNLGAGIEIVNQMIDEKSKIILAFTGNAVSSGLRDVIAFLVKHKFVDVLITTGAGIEEDTIKSIKPFVVGSFEASGRSLFEAGIGRIGNIFAPYDRYAYFEKFIDPFLDKVYKEGKIMTPQLFIEKLGLELKDEQSFLYWAAKNKIPVYSPGLIDGAIGDLMYFFKISHPDFHLDVIADHKKLIDWCLNQEKIGAIILGGGISKHYALNANILREGLDYAVYLTTAQEFDGSDSGGNQEEAKTWAKIKLNAPNVKIKSDFTLTFPILVAATFGKRYWERK